MRKVLVTATNYSKYCSEAKRLLEGNGFEVVENTLGRPFAFLELKELVHDIDAVVAGVDAWNEEVFSVAPNLKVIARFGVGVDNIDLRKAREHGITVTNAKGVNSSAVAELTIGFILCCLRNIVDLNSSIRSGAWDRFVGVDLKGKRVGLLGFGLIGQSVAKKLRCFEATVCAFDKFPDAEVAKSLGVALLDLEEVLRTSDIVCMHLPSVPETNHLMNKTRFGLMKNDTIFINTARGTLVDEAALYEALLTGKLRAAAIDVYEKEPTQRDNPLFKLRNIICTPHTAGDTYETYQRTSLLTAHAIIDVFNGKVPQNVVN